MGHTFERDGVHGGYVFERNDGNRRQGANSIEHERLNVAYTMMKYPHKRE